MTKKTLEAAKRAAAAAKRAQDKLDELAKEESASRLAGEAARDVKEAADAAAEVEAEAQRQLALHEALQKEDPTLWERFKKWL